MFQSDEGLLIIERSCVTEGLRQPEDTSTSVQFCWKLKTSVRIAALKNTGEKKQWKDKEESVFSRLLKSAYIFM